MNFAISAVTRRLGQVSLNSRSFALAPNRIKSISGLGGDVSAVTDFRYFSSKKKQKKSPGDGNAGKESHQKKNQNLQHEEWVKFQQSLVVEGFQTGQTTKVSKTAMMGRKTRGGKSMRRRKEREEEEAALDRSAMEGTIGGPFPSRRFSDEETEQLLAEAYGTVPERAGPRRSRHLKRQKNRWFVVRKGRAIQKKFRVAAHERRMERHCRIAEQVQQVQRDAPDMVARDRAYQQYVLERWTNLMLLQEKGVTTKQELQDPNET